MNARSHWLSTLSARLRLPLMTAGIITAVWACDSGTGVGPATASKPVDRIEIENTAPNLVLGDDDLTDQFDVTNPALGTTDGNNADRRGRFVGVTVVWTSSNPAVVSVSTPSTVTAAAPSALDESARTYGTKVMLRPVGKGTATVTGTVTGVPTVNDLPVTVTLSVTVTAAPTRVVASPNPANIRLTDTPILTGRVFSADGSAVPAVVVWSCSDTLTAVVGSSTTIDGSHCGNPRTVGTTRGDTTIHESDVILYAKKAGTMRLIASYTRTTRTGTQTLADTVIVNVSSGVAKVVVTPVSANLVVGGQRVLTAKALDAAGNVISGLPITWGTRNAAVLSVDAAGQAKGVSSGSAPGQTATANAFATIGGVQGDAVLTVYRAPKIVVTPSTNTLSLNQQVTLHATLVDSVNNASIPVSAALITWGSDNPTLVRVVAVDDTTATATGLAIGATAARAFAGVGSGTASVTVAAVLPPSSLVVFVRTGATTQRPAVRTNEPLSAGGTIQFQTEVRDVNGALLVDPVVYTSSNTSIATVDAVSGLVTAKAAGVAQITAKSSITATLSSTVAVIVSAATGGAPASLVLTPSPATVRLGVTQQYTATVLDASGAVATMPAGSSVGFAVDDSNIAAITQAGLLNTFRTGTTVVRAFLVLANNVQTNIFAASTLTVAP